MDKQERCRRFVNLNPSYNEENSKHFVGDPVQGLLHVVVDCPVSGRYIRHQSDITLLFQQKKLSKSENAALANHFATPAKSPYSEGNYTDSQLLSFVKPRHIQSLSEMKAWSEYLNKKADELEQDFKDYVDELKQQQQQQQQQQSADPASATSSSV